MFCPIDDPRMSHRVEDKAIRVACSFAALFTTKRKLANSTALGRFVSLPSRNAVPLEISACPRVSREPRLCYLTALSTGCLCRSWLSNDGTCQKSGNGGS
jgi:hypothetical protein